MNEPPNFLRTRLALYLAIIGILLVITSVLIVNMVDGLTGSVNQVKKIQVPENTYKRDIEAVTTATPHANEIVLQRVQSDPNTDTLTLRGLELDNTTFDTIATKLPNLKSLVLVTSFIPTNGLKKLHNMQRLESIDLNTTNIGNEDVAAVAEIPNLKSVMINNTRITDDALATLTKLKHITHISVDNDKLSDKAVHNLLSRTKEIQSLSLQGNPLTIATIHDLQKFPKFKFLNLGNCGFSTADLCELKQIKHLEVLTLSKQDFGKDDLSQFASSLPQVERLVLSDSRLSNKQFLELAKMKSLTLIDVSPEAPITAYAKAEFKRMRPDVYISH